MVSTVQSLGLRVPKRNPPSADYVLLDQKRAEAWFGALPQANVGELARQTYQGLTDFNRVELSDALRIEVAERFGCPLRFFSSDELNGVDAPTAPSGHAMAAIGAAGVAEPAAILASGGGTLLQKKVRSGNVTLAVAVIPVAADRA